jgi:cytochrome c oxidase cbb3-type subunit 2
MKNATYLFAGIFASFALGWLGLAMVPQMQIGNLQPQVDEDAGDVYPINISGVVEQGRKVYAANGCFYCHSQEIRDPQMGADESRDWGARRTVARDYIYDTPLMLGSMRNGPDLTNIGVRQRSAQWHYRHLYNPRSVTPASIMPPFRFLFETKKITGARSEDALDLTGADAPPDGWEVVPSHQAKSLVGYLLLLDRSHPLKEIKGSQEAAK